MADKKNVEEEEKQERKKWVSLDLVIANMATIH